MVVRLVTCRVLPEPDPDQAPLLAALAAAGLDARLAAWDDPAADWRGGLSILRSTWNYHLAPDDFLGWVARAAAAGTLVNPAPVVRGNLHKRYLLELAAAGFPVVPTALLPRGASPRLAAVMAERGWTDVVVKPAISAASFRTVRARAGALDEAEAHLAGLLAERDVLVQPYLPAVEGHGERAVVWIDGAVTHAVRKSPRFAGGDERVSGALEPAADERALAAALVERAGPGLLYGRADIARDAHGGPLLMELELIEPSLFLVEHPPAMERLVRAIVQRA